MDYIEYIIQVVEDYFGISLEGIRIKIEYDEVLHSHFVIDDFTIYLKPSLYIIEDLVHELIHAVQYRLKGREYLMTYKSEVEAKHYTDIIMGYLCNNDPILCYEKYVQTLPPL